jgi:hypothetical protein
MNVSVTVEIYKITWKREEICSHIYLIKKIEDSKAGQFSVGSSQYKENCEHEECDPMVGTLKSHSFVGIQVHLALIQRNIWLWIVMVLDRIVCIGPNFRLNMVP